VSEPRALDDVFYDLTRTASKVLTRGRLIGEEDEQGSYHTTALEVPIDVIRALMENVEEARAVLRRSEATRRAA
jgi:hypothetical protein